MIRIHTLGIHQAEPPQITGEFGGAHAVTVLVYPDIPLPAIGASSLAHADGYRLAFFEGLRPVRSSLAPALADGNLLTTAAAVTTAFRTQSNRD